MSSDSEDLIFFRAILSWLKHRGVRSVILSILAGGYISASEIRQYETKRVIQIDIDQLRKAKTELLTRIRNLEKHHAKEIDSGSS